jgi:hypothetical protein
VRGKIEKPAVLGALIHLGECFDLLDTRFTKDLGSAFPAFKNAMAQLEQELPTNRTPANADGSGFRMRYRDCALLNWYLELTEQAGKKYDTVRGGFVEGAEAFEGSAIHSETHIQLAIRNASCLLGVFRPILSEP